MLSDLGMIGLRPPLSDAKRFAEYSTQNITSQVPCPHGYYAIAQYPSGAELWFHIAVWRGLFGFGREKQMSVGFTPFHSTDTDIFVTIDSFDQTDDDPIFSGRCRARAGKGIDDPICFQLVDFSNYCDRETPATARASIICLAQYAEAFESENAFLAAQSEDNRLPPTFVLPVGQLGPGDEADVHGPYKAMAMLAGKVLDLAHLEGDTRYTRMTIETFGGAYDVFAEAETIKGDVIAGGTVRAMGPLFGRLLPIDPKLP